MSELVDLVNRNGKVVRRAVLRGAAEQYSGLYLPIVIAVITNGAGQILVHERASRKTVNPGDIDHVCGGILSGETPEAAARRESQEEAGILPTDLRSVRQGVNSYGRYCHLFRGYSDDVPGANLNPAEVAWAAFMYLDELRAKHAGGELTFVDGFFEDAKRALAER